MSAAPDKPERARDLDAEQEVDLGRLWRATIARWWLLLIGFVAGAIIGLLVSLGGGKQWKATTEIYLGQPLSPSGAAPITSPPTSLGLATTYVSSESALRYAATRSGIPTAQLRGKISVKPILGLTGTKVGQPAPLMELSVTGAKAGRTGHAAALLADLVAKQFQPYAQQKIAVLQQNVTRDKAELADVTNRLKRAENAQAALAGSAANSQILSNYQVIIASASDQRLGLQNDESSSLQQIAAAQNIEQARCVPSPCEALAVNQGGPSRRSGVVIGAIIGFLLGLLAAVFWEPVAAQVRSHQTS
jgi:Chain length determinant protein